VRLSVLMLFYLARIIKSLVYMCARARGMERERTGSKWWSLLTSIGSDVCDVCVGCEVWVV